MNIYKNFLTKDEFKNIESIMMGRDFPWYFNDGITMDKDGDFQFVFTFIKHGKKNCRDELFNILKPLLNKLNIKNFNRIKANLTVKQNKIIEYGMHIDQNKGTTGIFYINNCNGYTKFETGEKIKSEKNKYVEFNSTLKHTGTSCTDKHRRVVINFNY
tara:strand:+ start:29 stop:502 length:474 start_codon:yes stop_codon:yes gene_type:complete